MFETFSKLSCQLFMSHAPTLKLKKKKKGLNFILPAQENNAQLCRPLMT